jgi:RHS repeat-associated protein
VAVVDKADTATPALYYVHTDHLGRPARMMAQNWAWLWDVIYAPFGGTAYLWDATTRLDIRFPGQWFQLESGLAYNWHRHYDATLGRYVQPDPIGLKDSVDGPNLYSYARLNPLANTDPQGLFTFSPPQHPKIPIETCSKKRSPRFWCQNVMCGAPHGGLHEPLCPDCSEKLQNGTPTLLENGQLLLPPPAPKLPPDEP